MPPNVQLGSDLTISTHTNPEPIEPMAHRFKKGNRIRLELANGDSPVTDVLWTHYYQPNKIGADTVHHSAKHSSLLILPVTEGY